jgi:DNA polymerase (family 10)
MKKRTMASKNKELAAIFSRIADAMEIKGETGFKVTAYRKVSRILEDLTEDIEIVAKKDQLQSLTGIGSGIAQKIEEYLHTGKMKKYQEVLSGIPESLLNLINIQGLGAKTIHLAYKELGVKNLNDLKKTIQDSSLARLHGMGGKKVENIKKGIKIYEHAQERIPIFEAVTVAGEVTEYLKKSPHITRISSAGSLRRMRETVGDIDILATGKEGEKILAYFASMPGVQRVLASGRTKASVFISVGKIERQVDLRVVDETSYGAALQYFTGSMAHNIKIRRLAREKGLKVSEYGVFKDKDKIAGADEEEVYKALGLSFIPPEMREDRGEIGLSLEGRLPQVVGYNDIKGDLHVHSQYSDGIMTIKEIADTAREIGYEYIAVCDHSQSVRYANGLTPERLSQQIKEIDRLNQKLKGVKILKGTEVDILQDGKLDFPDEILKELDFVVAAVHTGFKKTVTRRMLQAMENPYVNVIAHPTGRLISRREGYEVDIDKIFEGAKRTDTALELNAYYDRLDLNEFYLKKAKDFKVKISIGTDTHAADGLQMMQFGVGIARRAWLEKSDILNCWSYKKIKTYSTG